MAGTGGITLEFDITNSDVKQKLDILTRRVSVDLEQFMRNDIADYIMQRSRDRFANEGDDAVGGGWLPLSPATERIRTRKGYSPAHPINVRTGDLRAYITGSRGTVSGGGDSWELNWPKDPPSQDLFEKTQTAQRGKAFPNTPPRPVIGLSMTDYNDVTDMLARYISEGLV